MPKEIPAKPYTRHYHIAKATTDILEGLPGWMKMRTNPESVGFQFLNASAGIEAQRVKTLLDETLENQYASTAFFNEPWRVYITIHDESHGVMPIPNLITASGMLSDATMDAITLTQVDELLDLFRSPPTRLVPTEYKDTLKEVHFNDFTGSTAELFGFGRYTDWTMAEGILLAGGPSLGNAVQRFSPNVSTAVFNRLLNNFQGAQVKVTVYNATLNAGPIVRSSIDAQDCYFLLIGSGTGNPNNQFILEAKLFRRNGGTFTLLWEDTFDKVPLQTLVLSKLVARNLSNGSVKLDAYVGSSETDLKLFKSFVDLPPSGIIDGRAGMMSTSQWSFGNIILMDDFKIFEPERRGTIDLSNKFLGDNTIQAISYFRDYDPSGVIVAQEGLIIGIANDVTNPSGNPGYIILASGVSVFEDGLYLAENKAWGREKQSFSTIGFDETLTFDGSGLANLNRIPLHSTLDVLDILDLDSAGNATVVPPSSYTATYSASGSVQWLHPAARNSQYVAEYEYANYARGRFVTTTDNSWNHQKWVNTGPLFSTTALSDYTGTKVRVSDTVSPSASGRGLAVEPFEVRPGVAVEVDFTYQSSASGIWSNPHTADLLVRIGDPWFKNTNPRAVTLTATDGEMLITRDRYAPVVSGSLVRVPALTDISGSPWSSLEYVIWYNGEILNLPFTTQPAISTVSGNVSSYPDDYIFVSQIDFESHDRKTFVHPMTVIPVTHPSGRIDTLMRQAHPKDFNVTMDLDFRGITYDKDQENIWVLEQLNAQLYRYEVDGTLRGKFNILKPNRNSANNRKFIDISGIVFPFISHELPASHDLRGMVYLNDFLYIMDAASGVFHRINTFDRFTMDIEYDINGIAVYPAFTIPSGAVASDVWDISLDRDDNLFVTTPSGLLVFEFKYDYWIPDVDQSRIIYREKYHSVETDLSAETSEPDRGEI